MNSWNCCRLCLTESFLNPIFLSPEHSLKYTEIILNSTGVTVELHDTLPQEMCTECIEQINKIYKFRKQCLLIQESLLQQKPSYTATNGACVPKSKLENYVTIDITDYELDNIDEADDFTDNCVVMMDVEKTENKNLSDFEDSDEPLKLNKTRKSTENLERVKVRRKKTKFKDETDIVKTGKKRVREEIKCEFCPKVLTSKLSLRNHYKIHSGFDIVCEHCGKKFITKRLLLMHCRAKHGYEKTDKCSFCDYTASNAEQVKIHERLHTGERPFVCQHCNAGFHRKSSYLQHVAIHLPEKTVQCDQCPARFKSVTLMRIHRHRHRPPAYTFKCYICDSSFARRRNVLRHLSRIHAVVEASQPVERIKIA